MLVTDNADVQFELNHGPFLIENGMHMKNSYCKSRNFLSFFINPVLFCRFNIDGTVTGNSLQRGIINVSCIPTAQWIRMKIT